MTTPGDIHIKTAVDILILNDKKQILLGLRKTRAGFQQWGFPGGRQITGEKIKETIQRELIEEIGDEAFIQITKEVLAVRENKVPPFFMPHITIILKGYYKGGTIINMEPEKCERWQWFDLHSLPNNIFSCGYEVVQNYLTKNIEVITDWC